MRTPFVNTLFFCVSAVIGRICDATQISVWLVLMSSAVKFALSQTSQCTRIMRCISLTVIRSLVVIQVILLHPGHPQFQLSTNCCKTNPCAGSVHHLWAQCSSALKQLLFTTSAPGVQRYTTSAPYARQDRSLLMSEGVMADGSSISLKCLKTTFTL